MNHKEKIEILKKLSEQEFRQDLIIPLLNKMGYIAPVEHPVSNEIGRNIICFEYDKLNEKRFLAIVAKVEDLTGDTETNQGLNHVVNQVQQLFVVPLEDLFNMKQVPINEVWVMTSGKIIRDAEESMIDSLRKSNLDKQIKFIRDDKLVQLIDTYFGTYWSSATETKEGVIIQRDRLLKFIENLLIVNHIEKGTVESVKATILYSHYTPKIDNNIDGLHISRISPHSIELSMIDIEYDDYIFTGIYGLTNRIFAEAKRYLSRSFSNVEETLETADKISKLTNPEEFVNESYRCLAGKYPFNQATGHASKFLADLKYLQEGLNDLKYFKKYLKYKGKLEWAKEVSKSIPELLPEVIRIVDNCEEDEVVIQYSISDTRNKVNIDYDKDSKSICFTTKHKLKDIRPSHDGTNEGLIKSDIIIESALARFRYYLEKSLGYNENEWMQDYVD